MVEVDSRGRITLARFGLKAMTVIVEGLPDGGIVVRPAVVMTAAEAAHYTNPDTVTAVEHALCQARHE